jgi:glyoxylase-like metal-dependent hydrolase (beta-lactamase superfamily II)
MTHIEHVNFGWLHKPPFPPASCHCLMIHTASGIILVDTGIGMHDIAPGFQFLPEVTAIRQLQRRGIPGSAVTDIVLTHCDSDHVGGLSDFPNARVHVSAEEKANLDSGNPRYTPRQFSHGPRWQEYANNDTETLGLPSRQIHTTSPADIRLVPLFGHTLGHCGIAIHHNGLWVLHVGDAYYLRDELTNDNHPISTLSALRADDDTLRRESLDKLRRLTLLSGANLTYFGYHDVAELPDTVPAFQEDASDLMA